MLVSTEKHTGQSDTKERKEGGLGWFVQPIKTVVKLRFVYGQWIDIRFSSRVSYLLFLPTPMVKQQGATVKKIHYQEKELTIAVNDGYVFKDFPLFYHSNFAVYPSGVKCQITNLRNGLQW